MLTDRTASMGVVACFAERCDVEPGIGHAFLVCTVLFFVFHFFLTFIVGVIIFQLDCFFLLESPIGRDPIFKNRASC